MSSKLEQAICVHYTNPLFEDILVQDQDAIFEESHTGMIIKPWSKVIPQTDGSSGLAYPLRYNGYLAAIPRQYVEDNPDFKQLIPYTLVGVIHPQKGLMLYPYRRVEASSVGERRLLGKTSFGFGGHMSLEDAYMHWYDEKGIITHTEEGYAANMLVESIRRELSEELQLKWGDLAHYERLGGYRPTGLGYTDIDNILGQMTYEEITPDVIREAYYTFDDDFTSDYDNLHTPKLMVSLGALDLIGKHGFFNPSNLPMWGLFNMQGYIQQSGFIYDNSNAVGRVHLGVLNLCIVSCFKEESIVAGEDGIEVLEPVTLDEIREMLKDESILDTVENWSIVALRYLVDNWYDSIDELIDSKKSDIATV
jgi:hypothetical protein